MSANKNQNPVYEITIAGEKEPYYRLSLSQWMPPLPKGKSDWSKDEIQEFTLDVFNNEASRKWTQIENMVELDEIQAAPHRKTLVAREEHKQLVREFQQITQAYEEALKTSKKLCDARNEAFCKMIAKSEEAESVILTWSDYRGSVKLEQAKNLFKNKKYAHLATKDTIGLLEDAEANRLARK